MCIKNYDIYESFVADHLLTDCEIKIFKQKPKPKNIRYRQFKKIDYYGLALELNNFKLSDTNQLEMKFDKFINLFMSIFNKFCPIKTKSIKQRPYKKYVSQQTKNLINERDKCYAKHKRKPSFELLSKLQFLKKQVKYNIIKDTKSELNLKIKEKGMWGGINNLYEIKKRNNSDIFLPPDVINDFYINISTSSHLNKDVTNWQPHPSQVLPSKEFKFKMLQPEDVKFAWSKIKNNKSSSMDTMDICPLMISLAVASSSFLENLTKMLNLFIAEGEIPQIMKIAKVIPIPKISKPTSPNDTRPITIQPILTKLLEKCLQFQLSHYIEQQNILSPEQYGFRKNHSTSHALLALNDFLKLQIDEDKVSILVSLDFKKAFDKTDRDILAMKLGWYKIEAKLLQALMNGRGQFVCCECNGEKRSSATKFTTLGVVQGSCLSCILFALLINDLPLQVKNSVTIMFADDSSLIISGLPQDIKSVIQKLEYDLVLVSKWLELNRIELNDDKVLFMIVGKKSKIAEIGDISVKLNDKNIKRVRSLKVLGTIFDEFLDFTTQTKTVIKKCYATLSLLYPIRKLLNVESRTILANSLILSKLKYAGIVWSINNKNIQKQVDKMIRIAARFVFCKRKYDKVSDEINFNLEWLNCKYCFKFEVLKLAYKINEGSCPDYFKNYLVLDNPKEVTTRNCNYFIPNFKAKSSWGESTFKMIGSNLWLNLDNEIKQASSFAIFKIKLYAVLLNNQIADTANINDIDNDDLNDDLL
jgi:hypothetical protein